MDYFISVQSRNNVRFSALFLLKEEKSSNYRENVLMDLILLMLSQTTSSDL